MFYGAQFDSRLAGLGSVKVKANSQITTLLILTSKWQSEISV